MFHKYTYENLLSKIHIRKPFIFTTIYPISNTNYSLDSMCIGKRYIYIYIFHLHLRLHRLSHFCLVSKLFALPLHPPQIKRSHSFVCQLYHHLGKYPQHTRLPCGFFGRKQIFPVIKKSCKTAIYTKRLKLKRPIIKVFQFYFKRYFDCINNFYLSLMIFLVLMMKDDKKFKSSN